MGLAISRRVVHFRASTVILAARTIPLLDSENSAPANPLLNDVFRRISRSFECPVPVALLVWIGYGANLKGEKYVTVSDSPSP